MQDSHFLPKNRKLVTVTQKCQSGEKKIKEDNKKINPPVIFKSIYNKLKKEIKNFLLFKSEEIDKALEKQMISFYKILRC